MSSDYDFTTVAHGKWILSGEHAVLRGHPALVFPVPGRWLGWSYRKTATPLSIEFNSPYSDALRLILQGLLEETTQLVGRSYTALTGQLSVTNTIPMGAGMGFSAALCVAVARWLAWKGWIAAEMATVFCFAQQLENYFHGISSGVDIVGTLFNEPMRFVSPTHYTALSLTWKPTLALSYAEGVSVTAQCIEKVQRLWDKSPESAQLIDAAMERSVQEAQYALTHPYSSRSLIILSKAIQQAHDCFDNWGLIYGEMQSHIASLLAAGALAAKPTGAGHGGYVLSLWADKPEADALPFPLEPAVEV